MTPDKDIIKETVVGDTLLREAQEAHSLPWGFSFITDYAATCDSLSGSILPLSSN